MLNALIRVCGGYTEEEVRLVTDEVRCEEHFLYLDMRRAELVIDLHQARKAKRKHSDILGRLIEVTSNMVRIENNKDEADIVLAKMRENND